MQSEITSDVRITPSEVRSFYSRIHRDSVPLINGQAQVAQIVVYPPYSQESITDLRQSLLEIRRRVIAGERFTMLATLSSECPSAMRGGELGFMNRGDLDPEFARAAWALKTPGEVSRIVESKMGFHIIQLIERRGDQANVRHILMTPKVDPEATKTAVTRLDSIASLINSNILDWNRATLLFSRDERTRFNGGVMINPNTYSVRFDMDQFESSDFEVIKDLNVGEISSPYQSRDENNRIVYKIVKLNERSDPRRASILTDYDFLQELAMSEKMDKVVQEWVDEKIGTSYIYIDESFKRCGLSNNWLKQ
jgi:peptidyl-prolyl cis-trans isomerase SurA